MATYPFKLTMDQDREEKEVYNNIIFSNLNKKAALKILKSHNYTDEAKNSVIKKLWLEKKN